mgnify:FL=1
MKGLEVATLSLVAHSDSAVVGKPGQRALNHVTDPPQAATVQGTVSARGGQKGLYVSGIAVHQVVARSVGVVPEERRRSAFGPSPRTLNWRNAIQQLDGRLAVMHVGRGGLNDQRDARGIGDQVAFAAFLAPVRRVGSGVAPQKTARTLALSMTARDRSILPSRPSRSSSRSRIRGQTPAAVQSRSRRQQVTPLPQPNSAGIIRQGMPVRSTNTMPVRQARLETGGRPPLGLGRSGGSRGSISFHSSSVTNVNAMTLPPYRRRHSDHRQGEF